MADPTNPSSNNFNRSRRRFVAAAPMLAGAIIAVPVTMTHAHASSNLRRLRFHHTHTGEKLTIDYHDGVTFIPDALDEINNYLRDFRTGEQYPIDIKLLDNLFRLGATLESHGTYEVISGYRSPATNAKLRAKSTGVAKRSLHMQGRAIDVRLTGCNTRVLYKACRSLSQGGTGYYGKSDFIHMDTGRVRYW